MGKRDELLARILDAAAGIKKREDQLRRKTHDLHTRVVKCTEVDGGVFEHLFQTVTNLISPCNMFVVLTVIKFKVQLIVSNFSFFITVTMLLFL